MEIKKCYRLLVYGQVLEFKEKYIYSNTRCNRKGLVSLTRKYRLLEEQLQKIMRVSMLIKIKRKIIFSIRNKYSVESKLAPLS